MREFYKTVPASMGGKTVKRSQGEIIAQQMVKNAIVNIARRRKIGARYLASTTLTE